METALDVNRPCRPASNCRAARFRRGGKVAAFTLMELLVVIAIISLLISIIIPALNMAKERAVTVLCASQEHQISLGLVAYAMDYHDKLPPASYSGFYGGQANVLRGEVFDELLETYGTAGEFWFCPNNIEAFRAWWGDEFPRCYRGVFTDDLGTFDDVRIGYNYTGGLHPGYQTVETTPEKIQSPQTMDDPSDWPLCADFMGLMWNQTWSQTYTVYEAFEVSHLKASRGGIVMGSWEPVIPGGSNVVYLDGHVEWRPWPELKPRQRSTPRTYSCYHFW